MGGDSHPWRGKQATIPTLQSVLQQWPHTFFYIDIKSPDADPTVMGQRLLEVLKTTDSPRSRAGLFHRRPLYRRPCRQPSLALSLAVKPAPGLPIFRSAISASQRVNAMVSSGMDWS